MHDLTRRTLRTWAVAGVLYAAAISWLAIVYIPWKTPVANAAVVAYAALHAAAAPGLWRGRRWGWRLALVGGLLGLLAAVVVTAGLLASWAYLRAIYGDFGTGASLAALIFASAALQVLGLYPALLVRALLRREVRADMAAGRGLASGVMSILVIPVAAAALTFQTFRLDPEPPVDARGREQAVRHLLAAAAGTDRPDIPALRGVPVGPGPVFVTLWDQGRIVARVEGVGVDLAGAVRAAADALADEPAVRPSAPSAGYLRIDRIVAAGPVASEWQPVLGLSVAPGRDGLRRCRDGRCRTVLPDDLVRARRFGAAPLIPGIRELRVGLDAAPVLDDIGRSGGRLQRIRTESWVSFDGAVLPVDRGNTPPPATGTAAWRRAAIEGGDFILRQLRGDGRFHYVYDPVTGRHPAGGEYSLPRHAGTVYALALISGHTGEPRFRRGAERAIAWLGDQVPERCGQLEGACVVRGGEAWLGSTALTVVGILEYQRRTGDDSYAARARQLAGFLVEMQRPDGDFHHLYDVRRGAIDPAPRQMFYSEEAALALVMAHEVLGDRGFLQAAERALDFLTSHKYDDFLGHFIYGADHWTCIAAEEAWPRLRSPRFLEFCRGYAGFVRRIQYQPGHWNNDDFSGHYGFGAVMVPQAPAAAGFSEAIVSSYALSRHHGRPDPALLRQAEISLDALTRDQIRLDNAWIMHAPLVARGGIRRSLVEPEIRIDFTQHAASALIRGAAELQREDLTPNRTTGGAPL
jgi:hypothetical protein